MLSTISSFIWGDDLKLSENKKMLPGTKNDKFEEVNKTFIFDFIKGLTEIILL